MPELPEVETYRTLVEKFCLGSAIVKCTATEQGGGVRNGQFDDLVIDEDVTASSLSRSLEERTIMALRRRGKHIWFVLDKRPHVLFHFGMTGAFTIKGEKRHGYWNYKVGDEWPPRFTKLELQMSNGNYLALTDPRRLGRVRLRMEPETQPPISLLAPDPLTNPVSLEAFAAALAKLKAPIKAVLLNQERVVSGVGNWVADEVCFQACVHPGATCDTLAPYQVAALHSKILSVCQEACGAKADYSVFPPDWLFHHRWSKGKTSEAARLVSSGHSIQFDEVGGRTTAFVPAVQVKGLLPLDSSKTRGAPAKRVNKRSSNKVGNRACKKTKDGMDDDAIETLSARGPVKHRYGSSSAKNSSGKTSSKVKSGTEHAVEVTSGEIPKAKRKQSAGKNSETRPKSTNGSAAVQANPVEINAKTLPRTKNKIVLKKSTAAVGREKRKRGKDAKQNGSSIIDACASAPGSSTIEPEDSHMASVAAVGKNPDAKVKAGNRANKFGTEESAAIVERSGVIGATIRVGSRRSPRSISTKGSLLS